MIKNLVIAGILLCSLVGMSVMGNDNDNDIARASKTALGQPFWSSKVMENEPLLFIQERDKSVASAKLLFMPTVTPTITSPDLMVKYQAGKDYVWKPGDATVDLMPGSRIPFKTAAEMNPAKGGLGGRLHSEGHYFHDLQVQATYAHEDVWTWHPSDAIQELPRSMVKLNEKKTFKIVAVGDSITEGYNASGFKKVWTAPFQPSYPQLVANTLQQRFDAPVVLVNLGVAGTQAGAGFSMIEKLQSEKPDLVIIAYGMNNGQPGEEFEAIMRKLLVAFQTASLDADVILVASMTQAPHQGKVSDKFFAYRDALSKLVSKNVVLADVTTPFAELLKRKQFSDLSGNNYNHPNDFTHRLYAQIICQYFQVRPEGHPRMGR